MFGHLLREGSRFWQLLQLLGDLAPQNQRRHLRLGGQRRQHRLQKRQPGARIDDRLDMLAKHQRGIEQQKAFLHEIVLQLRQRLDGAVSARGLGDRRQRLPARRIGLQLAAGHQQHFHEVAQ